MKLIKIPEDGKLIRKLEGRGQAGFGDFYRFGDGVYLIKKDTPGTSLAEALVFQYNPLGHEVDSKPPIIQAEISFAQINSESIIIISKQPSFETSSGGNICGLDDVVLGHKRDPKTWWSEESISMSRDPLSIKKAISMMTPEAKKQFAHAIYTSQLNGDESLHTGKFMVERSRDGKQITKIQRIDFGALGRFAEARTDFNPFHTSEIYTSSGQYEKDYVNFLLQDKEINNHLLELWANTDVTEVMRLANDRFLQETTVLRKDCLPGSRTALLGKYEIIGFYNQLIRGMHYPTILAEEKPIGESLDLLKTKFLSTVKKRCEEMIKSAKKEKEYSDKIELIEETVEYEDLTVQCDKLFIAINDIMKNERLKPSERISMIINKIKPSNLDSIEWIKKIRAITITPSAGFKLRYFAPTEVVQDPTSKRSSVSSESSDPSENPKFLDNRK